MAIEVLTLWASATASSVGAASIDIPTDGKILNIDWSGVADCDADAEYWSAFLSFIASAPTGVNDVRNILSSVYEQFALTTSGVYKSSVQKSVNMRPGLHVNAGERLYMHIFASTGVITDVYAHLLFESGLSSRRPARRR